MQIKQIEFSLISYRKLKENSVIFIIDTGKQNFDIHLTCIGISFFSMSNMG